MSLSLHIIVSKQTDPILIKLVIGPKLFLAYFRYFEEKEKAYEIIMLSVCLCILLLSFLNS
jgi:hypothetical protein